MQLLSWLLGPTYIFGELNIKLPTLLDCSKANLSVKVAMLIAGIYETKVLYLNTLLLLTLDYESVAFCHNINSGKVQQNVFRYHDISYLSS